MATRLKKNNCLNIVGTYLYYGYFIGVAIGGGGVKVSTLLGHQYHIYTIYLRYSLNTTN